MSILDNIGKKVLIFDGAMGTMVQAAGMMPGDCPDAWCITHPDTIRNIHLQYLRSGCNVVTTATFSANTIKIEETGFTTEQVARKAVSLAREAIRESGKEAFVALDLGPTGKILYPFGELPFEDAVEAYAPLIRSGSEAGADLILLETFTDLYEMKAAIIAAKENCDLPIFASFTPDQQGRLLTGGEIETAAAFLEGIGVSAIGMNCGMGPDSMLKLLPRLRASTTLPIFVNSNAGLPVIIGDKTVYTCDAESFSDLTVKMLDYSVSGIGGCCGTTPEYIRLTAEKTEGLPLSMGRGQKIPCATSYGKRVRFDSAPVVIGERINPTGKPKLKKALQNGNYEYLVSEALRQIDAGAELIDVNAGVPGIDEGGVLREVVLRLQSVTDTPLQIDTANPVAMEKALRIYNGRPVLNSVNGKKEVMDVVFPLAQKYGAMLVALLLDEDGIPSTAEGRMQIRDKIMREAGKYGFSESDILFDALTMTVSTGEDNAAVTLECVQNLTDNGNYSILGVSNVSFGLPEREILNTAFLHLAMEHGLSAAIMNPLSDRMMDAQRAFCALRQMDPHAEKYLKHYAGSVPETHREEKTETVSLYEAIVRGLQPQAVSAADTLSASKSVSELLEEQLIPALNEVGDRFSKGQLFLPQLLMSAEAASGAFDILREKMRQQGEQKEPIGTILLATVQGDIHDIGKNIAKALLENYNYEVLDLGRDVSPEKIVETVLEKEIRLVGLSALMTTTVPAMENTIRLLREKAPFCRIMVGGAVLTKEYAEKIGADRYVPDAMADVLFAREVFGQ
ncbi:MAG: homocysteine S-methyltransferase family protein [Clostridia bacterium]|nr:homocysteine S-methyltransferase family protein [Clostridia bacterium]